MSKIENGKVEVPRDYFLRMAKFDYSSYRHALAREFYQNSSDAGSSFIKVTFDNENRCITIEDDGCGMDYDTIKNKLLVLGGSKKKEGDTGAFGKAKEVLYFSWERYEVRTGHLLVEGQGADYTIQEVEDYCEGTTSKIWIWDNEDFGTFYYAFRNIGAKFQISTQILINGEPVNTSLNRGTFIRDLGWAELFVDDTKKKSWYFYVRINGQWMFERYHGEDAIGEVVLELKSDSLECLNSNRDSLKQSYNDQFYALLKEMVVDQRTALMAQNPVVRSMFKGTGKIKIDFDRFKEEVNTQFKKMEEAMIEQGSTIPSEQLMEGLTDNIVEILPTDNVTSVQMDRIADEVKKQEDGEAFNLERMAFIGYEPDFVLVYEEDERKKIEKYMKTKNAATIAKAWTEVLKQVLLDIGWYGTFTAGFNFGSSTTAMHEVIDGENYFYLNPSLLLHEVDKKERRFGPLVHKVMFREDLLQKAIHEVAHLKYESHSEIFILHAEWIRAQTWKSIDLYPKIIKEAFRR